MHPRICHIGGIAPEPPPERLFERLSGLGFDSIMASGNLTEPDIDHHPWARLADACQAHGFALLVHADFSEFDLTHPLVEAEPACFSVRYEASDDIADPRQPGQSRGRAHLRASCDAGAVAAWWNSAIERLSSAGISGVCVRNPGAGGAQLWRSLISTTHARSNRNLRFIADTTGTSWSDWPALAQSGFDNSMSSLAWWDGRARWFVEEHDALKRLAPPIALVESPDRLPPFSQEVRRARLSVAALVGSGILIPVNFLDPEKSSLDAAVRKANEIVSAQSSEPAGILKPTGAGANITVLMGVRCADERLANEALVCLINPDTTVAAESGSDALAALGDFDALEAVPELCRDVPRFAPGEARLFRATRLPAIRTPFRPQAADVVAVAAQPRLVIDNPSPVIDGGRFPARRIVGERVTVEADVFCDGHPTLAAELLWRAEDEEDWRRARMHEVGNDRWRGSIDLSRIGRYRFSIEAWIDDYGTFAHDLSVKRDAGQDIALETKEGIALVRSAAKRANGAIGAVLHRAIDDVERHSPAQSVALLLAPETMEAMHRAAERRFLSHSSEYTIDAERTAARFASWYELFPRSQTDSPKRSGTFRDTIARLPAIRDMGFDVLYLTPIHPIGTTRRKGRNNALEAQPGDPGSPYAIGASEGGHDAIHSDLGTLEDFRSLVTEASAHGMEVALDFAIQCSRDHPWLTQHPGWFAWRADGSIRFAENPPKKYEDIVNIDFYAADATPAAWLALRDIVLHWIDAGVRTFRVDNPHTKPFPFWEWLIADVRRAHPNTIFLSEAFTRPKVMYHLAKLGFTQSYTYFTWRNTKRELTGYMTEIATPPVSEFFRPHLFVNTPDINPHYLQSSGRAGFLARAALASTLSGLWGIYSGFELCESAAPPGREEYLDSEKYEIRPRDWSAPGNIIAEITQLNRLRKSEPALQTHTGLTFYNAFNDQILYYGKNAPGHRDRILVAVNLDPLHAQEAEFEIPLWEWSLSDHESLEVEDLLDGRRFVWHGKMQHMRLTPERPYALWRIAPARER